MLHNVHAGQPITFQSRWAMSYLRGPLTRKQIRELTAKPPVEAAAAPSRTAAVAAAPSALSPSAAQVEAATSVTPAPFPAQAEAAPPAAFAPESIPTVGRTATSQVPPQLPSAVKQVYVPVQLSLEEALIRLARQQGWSVRSVVGLEGQLVYDPALIGLAVVRLAHATSRQTYDQALTYLLPVTESGGFVDWSQGQVQLDAAILTSKPTPGAAFNPLPPDLGNASRLAAVEKEFSDYLFYNTSVDPAVQPPPEALLGVGRDGQGLPAPLPRGRPPGPRRRGAGDPGPLRDKGRPVDHEEAAGRARAGRRRDRVRRPKARRVPVRCRDGGRLLFTGHRMRRGISTASRKRRLTKQAKADVEESEDSIDDLEKQIQDLQDELEHKIDDLTARWAALIDEVKEETVRPRRSDVRVNLFGLAWLPHWEVTVPGQPLPYHLPAFDIPTPSM